MPTVGRAIATAGAERYPLNLLAVVRAEGSVCVFVVLCAGPGLHSDVHQAPLGLGISLGQRATSCNQAWNTLDMRVCAARLLLCVSGS